MKKLLFLSALIFLSQCKKEEDKNINDLIYKGFFYTYSESSNEEFDLFLNDIFIGKLPVFTKPYQCFTTNDSGIPALYAELKEGKYSILGKDEKGNVKTSGWFELKDNSVSSSSEIGNFAAGGTCDRTRHL